MIQSIENQSYILEGYYKKHLPVPSSNKLNWKEKSINWKAKENITYQL